MHKKYSVHNNTTDPKRTILSLSYIKKEKKNGVGGGPLPMICTPMTTCRVGSSAFATSFKNPAASPPLSLPLAMSLKYAYPVTLLSIARHKKRMGDAALRHAPNG